MRLDGPALTGAAPTAPTGRYCITGTIVDENDKPLEGVSVRVARGMGTLFSTEPVLTNAEGQYAIYFGPAMFSSAGPNLQAASVFASKPGYAEANLCRSGNLGMAEYRPRDNSDKDWGFVGVVYPDNPHQLDFEMQLASTVVIDLVNAAGNPLAGYSIDLDGEQLPPSSSVLASEKTNADGRVRFHDIPQRAFWMSMGSRRAEYRTTSISFETPGSYHYRLTYDDIAGTLTATVVEPGAPGISISGPDPESAFQPTVRLPE
jgi:hypothetical protein